MKFGYLTLVVALLAGLPAYAHERKARMEDVSPMPAHTMRNSSRRIRRSKSS